LQIQQGLAEGEESRTERPGQKRAQRLTERLERTRFSDS